MGSSRFASSRGMILLAADMSICRLLVWTGQKNGRTPRRIEMKMSIGSGAGWSVHSLLSPSLSSTVEVRIRDFHLKSRYH